MQPATQRDAELPAAIAAIDWSAALAAHGRWLRTVVIARLGEPQAADEVMQELSLAVIKQSAPLADASKLAPWLYRLAVRQALLYRRVRGRQRKLAGNYADHVRPGEFEARSDDPLVWLLADERRLLVRQAIARLLPRDAEILLLKYTEDWSYHDLVDRLGVSHSAVEARLHRARARLRRELAAFEVFEVR